MNKQLQRNQSGNLIAHKIIYNWQAKTQDQIFDAIKLEVEAQLAQHPGYELKQIGKPNHNADGSLLYIIELKKK